MTRLKVLTTSALTSFVLLAATAFAADPPPVKPGETGAQHAYRAKQVLGTKVWLQGNVDVGTVDDIVFDEAGQIEYLIVNKDDKLATIPWDAAKFNFEKRTALLNIPQDKYMALPTYTVQTYPSFYAPTYRVSTYRIFGLTPRERRMIERRP